MTVIIVEQHVANFFTQAIDTSIIKIESDLLVKSYLFSIDEQHPGQVSMFIQRLVKIFKYDFLTSNGVSKHWPYN